MAQAVATATTDQDALQYLLAGPTTLRTNVSELARTWGWNRTRVRRRLHRWAGEGRIEREILEDGTSTITVLVNTVVNNTVNIAVHPVVTEVVEATPAPRHQVALPQLNPQRLVALPVFCLAGAIAFFGLRINAWYGSSLAADPTAAYLLAGLSVCADLIALLMPTVARTMALAGQRTEARAAWALAVVALGVSLLAAIGFAAVNIADSTAGRDKVATQAAGLRAEITRLETELASIHETRPVAALDAALQAAQADAGAVWSATSGCSDITRSHSKDLCAPVLGLRQARAEAARADEANLALREAHAKLAALPAVTQADPQGEMAASLLRWISGGLIHADAHDISMVRIFAMTLLPQISGLILMLASGLWRQRR